MSEGLIYKALTDIINTINSKAATLQPAIFPSGLRIYSVVDFCGTDQQRSICRDWLQKNAFTEHEYGFRTMVNYDNMCITLTEIKGGDLVDVKLLSLEDTLKMMIMGTEDEINISIRRFLEINGYKGDIINESHIFHEVYNLAYALKIAISNIPNMKLFVNNHPLPLNPEVDIIKVLDSLLPSNNQESEGEEDDFESNTEKNLSKKRRRKKKKNV